jgi:hypothetical protein
MGILNKVKIFARKYRLLIFFLLVAAFVLPEITVYFNRPMRGTDILGYFAAGSDALNRAPLYAHSMPGKNNTWPPFFSVFMIPLTIAQTTLGIPITKELWYFFNFFCLIGMMQLWIQMLYGIRPVFCSKTAFDFSSPKVFVPFLLLLPAFVGNFFMLQINVFILFLVTLGFYSMVKKRSLTAGLFFGFAAALKAFPGFIVLYLLIRRQWKTAGCTIAAGLLFSLIPIILYGPEQFFELFKQWLSLSLVQTLIIDNIHNNNQSVYAMWYRFLVYQIKVCEPGSMLLKSANLASIGLITVVTMSFFALKKFNPSSFRTLVEFSAVCVLMNIFPPIGWAHYFVFLFPAAAVMWSAYYNKRELFKGKAARILAWVWPLLLLVPYCAGDSVSQRIQAYSNYTIASFVLLSLLSIFLAKLKGAGD